MTHSAAKATLKSIVEWLENGGQDGRWDDHIDLAQECLGEMSLMAQPLSRPDKTATRSREPVILSPEAGKLQEAIPHVQQMIDAMKRRDTTEALRQAKEALSKLQDQRVIRLKFTSIEMALSMCASSANGNFLPSPHAR